MGIIASIIAAALSSSKDLLSKKISAHIDGSLSAFASFFFALPYYLVLLLVLAALGYEEFAFSSQFLILVVFRSITDSMAEWLKMEAIQRGDISYVSNFISLSPLFLLFTSPLITGDEIPAIGVFAVVIIVLGSLVLVYEPKQEGDITRSSAIAYGLGSSLFFSLNTCFDRLAVQVASPALSGFAMTALAALLLSPSAFRRRGNLRQAYLLCSKPLWGRGLAEVAFMVTKLFALQYLQAPFVAGISKVSLLFSIVGGRVIYNETQFARRIFAGFLVLVGVAMIVWLEL